MSARIRQHQQELLMWGRQTWRGDWNWPWPPNFWRRTRYVWAETRWIFWLQIACTCSLHFARHTSGQVAWAFLILPRCELYDGCRSGKFSSRSCVT